MGIGGGGGNAQLRTQPQVVVFDKFANLCHHEHCTFQVIAFRGSFDLVALEGVGRWSSDCLWQFLNLTLGIAGHHTVVFEIDVDTFIMSNALAEIYVLPGPLHRIIPLFNSSVLYTACVPLRPHPKVVFEDAHKNRVATTQDIIMSVVDTATGNKLRTVCKGRRILSPYGCVGEPDADGSTVVWNVSIIEPSGSVVLEFSASTVPTAYSKEFVVIPGRASSMMFIKLPSSGFALEVLKEQPIVGALDSCGNIAAFEDNVVVWISLRQRHSLAWSNGCAACSSCNACAHGVASGCSTRTSNGVAVFPALVPGCAVTGGEWVVETFMLPNLTAGSVRISPGAAQALELLHIPTLPFRAGLPLTPPLSLKIVDASGSHVHNVALVCQAHLSTLSCDFANRSKVIASTASESGVATFPTLVVTGPSTAVLELTLVCSTLRPVSLHIYVEPSIPAIFKFLIPMSSVALTLQPVLPNPTACVFDQYDNFATPFFASHHPVARLDWVSGGGVSLNGGYGRIKPAEYAPIPACASAQAVAAAIKVRNQTGGACATWDLLTFVTDSAEPAHVKMTFLHAGMKIQDVSVRVEPAVVKIVVVNVSLVIQRDFATFDVDSFLDAFTNLLAIDRPLVRVLSIKSGSVLLDLEMRGSETNPTAAAEASNTLKMLAEGGSGRLRQLGVTSVAIDGTPTMNDNSGQKPGSSSPGEDNYFEGTTGVFSYVILGAGIVGGLVIAILIVVRCKGRHQMTFEFLAWRGVPSFLVSSLFGWCMLEYVQETTRDDVAWIVGCSSLLAATMYGLLLWQGTSLSRRRVLQKIARRPQVELEMSPAAGGTRSRPPSLTPLPDPVSLRLVGQQGQTHRRANEYMLPVYQHNQGNSKETPGQHQIIV